MRRKKQNILEMEFNDSEPDSDDEPVENDHQEEVQVEPAWKRNKAFDLAEQKSILTAAEFGATNRHIAREMGVSDSSIRAIRVRCAARDNCLSKSGSGRPRKCSALDVRAMMREIKKNPFISASEIRLMAGVHHVSEDTVLRVIHRSGEFNCYWAARKPFITAKNVAKRLE